MFSTSSYKVCVFRANQKTKMAAKTSDWLGQFWLLVCNRWNGIWPSLIESRFSAPLPLPSWCFWADMSSKMAFLASDWLRHVRLFLCNPSKQVLIVLYPCLFVVVGDFFQVDTSTMLEKWYPRVGYAVNQIVSHVSQLNLMSNAWRHCLDNSIGSTWISDKAYEYYEVVDKAGFVTCPDLSKSHAFIDFKHVTYPWLSLNVSHFASYPARYEIVSSAYKLTPNEIIYLPVCASLAKVASLGWLVVV